LSLLVAGLLACGPADEGGGDANGSVPRFDALIAGGTVIDGSGQPGRRADLLLREGRIAFIGMVDPDTLDVVDTFDATGLTVTPGFIDAHAHGDPVSEAAFHNFLAMGVTTIVLGQDGSSPPVAELSAHLDAVDASRSGVNIVYLVGHNTIRVESGVGYAEPGSEDLVRMSELAAVGLRQGAFGLSTGLEYDPGSKSGADELAAVAAPVAEVGGVVSSHMRSEDADRVVESLDELIEQGRRSGARVHVSHMKIVLEDDTGSANALLERMSRARDAGIEISADVYPYTASFTGVSILFPDWARPPNDYARVVASRGPELLEHLRRRVEGRNGPGAVLFGTGEWAGRTLEEVASETGVPFEEILVELGPEGPSAAYFVMDEAVMRRLFQDPHVVGSSDGSPTMLHPRGYGSFPRIIRELVVRDSLLTLEEAIRKLTSAPAAIYRLDDGTITDPPRGLLRIGFAADILAFDPDRVMDVADFENPHRLARGMDQVWVNGVPRLSDGLPTADPGSGEVLRARW
jgi:N-acyl-D-aspartate/D-glutamate deacylase